MVHLSLLFPNSDEKKLDIPSRIALKTFKIGFKIEDIHLKMALKHSEIATKIGFSTNLKKHLKGRRITRTIYAKHEKICFKQCS
jgi:hypothetical protein